MATRKKLPKGFRRWDDIKDRGLTRSQIAESDAEIARDVLEMKLGELRRELGLTQSQVAEAAKIAQPDISRIEAGNDHLVSTLQRVVHALGGTLEIVANINGRRVKLIDA